MENLINTKQAIAVIGCNRRTLTKYISDGLLVVDEVIKGANHFKAESVKALISIYENQKSSVPKKYVKEVEKKEISKPKIENAPAHELNEIGLQVMSEAIDELKALGVYRNSDNIALNSYAMQYQLYVHFQNKAMISDSITYDTKGNEKISPYAVIADKHFTNYLKIQQNLGLNPSARQKLTIKEKEELDEMGDLF